MLPNIFDSPSSFSSKRSRILEIPRWNLMRKRISLVTNVCFSFASLAMSIALGCDAGSDVENNCSSGSVFACSCANGQPGTRQCFGGTVTDCQCGTSSGAGGSMTTTGASTGAGSVANSGSAGATSSVTNTATAGRVTTAGGRKAATGGKKATGAGGATSKAKAGAGGASTTKASDKCPSPLTCVESSAMNTFFLYAKFCSDLSEVTSATDAVPPLCTSDEDCDAVGLPDVYCQNLAGMMKACVLFCSP